MAISRDLDGRMILPLERVEALARVIMLRQDFMDAGHLPYPRDWPLPCPECNGSVDEWVGSGDEGRPSQFWFSPCGHGIVAAQPAV